MSNLESSNALASAKPSVLKPSAARSRAVLVLIALCFLTPIVAALLLQSPWLHLSAKPTKNFGELIFPVVPIQSTQWQALQRAPALAVEAQWTLLYLPPESCGACVAQTSLLAHIRTAAGRELDRVRLELVSERAFALPPEATFSVYQADRTTLAALRGALGLAGGGVVIVDPLRNAMMRFPNDAQGNFDGSKVRKDMARLLKASQVGKSQSTGVIS
jgi:hypothetical protein